MEKVNPRLALGVNTLYIGIQAVYWVLQNIITCYAAIILRYQNVPLQQVGLASALVCFLSLVLQPLAASYADRHRQVPLGRILALLTVAALAIFSVSTLFPHVAPPVPMLLFVAGGALVITASPLISAMAVRYSGAGIPVNFSVARGVGSAVAGTMGFVFGLLVEVSGEMVVFYARIICCVLLVLLFLLIPAGAAPAEGRASPATGKGKPAGTASAGDAAPSATPSLSIAGILKGNIPFALFLFSSALAFVSLSSGMTYLINIVEGIGGGTTEFGLALLFNQVLELPAMLGYKKLVRRVQPIWLLVVCMVFVLAKALLLLLAKSVPMVYVAVGTQLLSTGLFFPASVDFTDRLMAPTEKVRGQALVGMASFGVGIMLGNLFASLLMGAGGLHSVLVFSCVSGAGALLVIAVALAAWRKEQPEKIDS